MKAEKQSHLLALIVMGIALLSSWLWSTQHPENPMAGTEYLLACVVYAVVATGTTWEGGDDK